MGLSWAIPAKLVGFPLPRLILGSLRHLWRQDLAAKTIKSNVEAKPRCFFHRAPWFGLIWEQKLVGGLENFVFSIIYINIWDNPSHWLIFFKMVKTTNQKTNYGVHESRSQIFRFIFLYWSYSWETRHHYWHRLLYGPPYWTLTFLRVPQFLSFMLLHPLR